MNRLKYIPFTILEIQRNLRRASRFQLQLFVGIWYVPEGKSLTLQDHFINGITSTLMASHLPHLLLMFA